MRTACPVAVATRRPAPAPGHRISVSRGKKTERTDYSGVPRRRKMRRNRTRRRAANGTKTKEVLGTLTFPEKQRTLGRRKEARTRPETAMSQEGRG
ncbi:hypothetical protein NDU88_006484 [Pleurodeles waltl]|uniref:Uncharacterized protein n=1 Tax=Pleurodeles waltl TaxID=8319 RepID=A0AAV7MCD6_PLEWA|nr:hypothetical protein NDU88_006484 [Pleurodeles waltl]